MRNQTNKKKTSKTLFLVALEVELPAKQFPQLDIVYTGVGKVNAAYQTMKSIAIRKPDMIINFGSAGAVRPNISGLVQVSKVIQRDIDLEGLGFQLGQTPFEDGGDFFVLEDCSKIDKIGTRKKVLCSTGDNFVSDPPRLSSDIVDMELYAIAKVCAREGVPLYSWKFISDNADSNSPGDWEQNVARGVLEFKKTVLSQFL